MCRILAVLLFLPAVGLAQAKQGREYAFLVSCGEKYNKAQLHPLPKSFRDMDDFRKALLQTGFDEQNIVFMHDATPKPQRLLPEKDKIIKQLNLLLASVEADDTLIVALNGHGLHFKGDKTSYFCPLNAVVADKKTLIPMDGPDGLFPILKACKAKRKLLIVGACRNDPAKTSQAAETVDLDLFDPDEVPAGVVALYSCKAGQKTYFEEKMERSYFFDHLVRAWQGEFHPGTDKISLESIFEAVKVRTSAKVRNEYGEAQVPDVRREYQGEWLVNRAKYSPKLTPAPGDPEPGKEQEFEIYKGVRMSFCWIPAGEAMLGRPLSAAEMPPAKEKPPVRPKKKNLPGEKTPSAPPPAKERTDAEKEHLFATKGFWLGKYEVTQREYEGVTGTNPSKFKGATLPVEMVKWADCQAFVEKCGVKGFQMKLPHENEWEYACQGGNGNKRHFYWGDDLNGDKANCDGNFPCGPVTGKGPSKLKTTDVGRYDKLAPHPWGLCDMHGNVWEWCENVFEAGSPKRVFRGGSWNWGGHECRTAYRCPSDPESQYEDLGFRLVLVP